MWNVRLSIKSPSRFVLSIALAAALSAICYGQDPTGRPPEPKGGKKPPPKRPDARLTVILTVLTDQPGSGVYLNGEARGTTNSEGKVVFEKLPLGHYTVEVRKQGFNSAVRGFQAGTDSPTLVFKLDPKLEDVSGQFDSLIQSGKLTGPEKPNALDMVNELATKYPDKPEVRRMRAVLSGKLIEKLGPVIDRTIKSWRAVTREDLDHAQDLAAQALTLKSDDRRLQAQTAYLRGAVALREWQTAVSQVTNAEGSAEAASNAKLSVARTELERAVAFDDTWAASWYQMGLVRLYGTDLGGAEAAFNKVAQLEPKWAIAQAGLGATYYAWAKYKESTEAYKKAIDLDKSYAVGYAGLGLARAARGDKDAAKDIKKAMDLDPSSALPHFYLGTVYSKSKKKDEAAQAVPELKEAMRKNPENLEFQNRVAEQLIADLEKAKR